MIRDAAISECGRYRYALERRWQAELGGAEAVCMFVMLNPSIADAFVDDPTLRRCIGFARTWGYTSLVVCNLFAFRATDPGEMMVADDPVGPENDDWIRRHAEQRSVVVAAWGTHGGHRGRDQEVLDVLAQAGHGLGRRQGQIFCLGTTRSGQPLHPLYVSGAAVPLPYA